MNWSGLAWIGDGQRPGGRGVPWAHQVGGGLKK